MNVGKFFLLGILGFQLSAFGNFLPDDFDPLKIDDLVLDGCRVKGNRTEFTDPLAFFQVPPPVIDLKASKVEWDDIQKSFVSVVDDKFLVRFHRMGNKTNLPQGITDQKEYVKQLQKVPYLSVDVLDRKGKRVQVRNFDHVLQKKVELNIGNYNGVFVDLGVSNAANRSLIVIHDPLVPGEKATYSRISVSCEIEAVWK